MATMYGTVHNVQRKIVEIKGRSGRAEESLEQEKGWVGGKIEQVLDDEGVSD